MPVFRLNPISPRLLGRSVGRCAACEKPVSHPDRTVRIYGDLFHYACAYFEPRGVSRDRGRADVA